MHRLKPSMLNNGGKISLGTNRWPNQGKPVSLPGAITSEYRGAIAMARALISPIYMGPQDKTLNRLEKSFQAVKSLLNHG